MGEKIADNAYYSKKLSAEKLKKCYDLATPRIRQYLDEELKFVVELIPNNSLVLELGCGYGRIFTSILEKTNHITGIDNSIDSLFYGKALFKNEPGIRWIHMDASDIDFKDDSFDVVLCIQNGISALKVDPTRLIHDAVRITKPGGYAIFSTYASSFWEYRLLLFLN